MCAPADVRAARSARILIWCGITLVRVAEPDVESDRTPMALAEHEFGGPWTEVKLDAISDYLSFFTNALKNKFELWYIDAFAGSGERTATQVTGGILDGTPIDEERVQLAGSAKRALAIQPPFHHFVFIEQHRKRHKALEQLVTQHPEKDIQPQKGDGNELLSSFFAGEPWATQEGGRGKHRGVVFLDPYAMKVRWETLQSLARTGAIDVWYLFPLNAVVRQLAHDFRAVDKGKQASLDQIFGTTEWREQLYSTHTHVGLFDEVDVSFTRRSADQRKIEQYARDRLKTLFPYVSDPLPLLMPSGAQLFSLFCLSANTSGRAQSLVAKGVAHVLKKYD